MRSSLLVAESLRLMTPPTAGAMPPFDTDSDRLRARWRQATTLARSEALPPTCLYPAQVESWRRVIAALDNHGAALLAEPVGSGKSWIALATAIHFGSTPLVTGPAALESQWRRVALRAGVKITWISHERLSRGRLLPDDADLAIVDEAHRFRHLATRRAEVLAPWLPGRRVLLLTATPIINRRSDIVSLLRLILPDDALCLDGVQSLRDLAEMRLPPAALARVVIRSRPQSRVVPLEERQLACSTAEDARAALAVRVVSRLELARSESVRRLLTSVLLDAAASSDAAWRVVLKRYRALLLQSRDAGGLSRTALRQFAGSALDQLVLWPLLGELPAGDAPRLADLAEVDAALAVPAAVEPWLCDLRDVLADGRPTVCFARHRATAAMVVSELGRNTAWVNGSAGGIGALRMTREQVLAAFGTNRAGWRLLRSTPSCLVATEVVAEGLDLQGASRVIHLDLPWHAARLDQRVGRVLRIGQAAGSVEVITRETPPSIERVLHIGALVRGKGRLASRWLDQLSIGAPTRPSPGKHTWLAVAPSAAANVEAHALVGLLSGNRSGTIALELVDGAWRQATATPEELPELLATDVTSDIERTRLRRLARRACWRALELARPQVVSRPRLVSRLLTLARQARIDRDRDRLERLDTLLAAASRALPLGSAAQLEALVSVPDHALLSAHVAPPAEAAPREVEWLAVILYRGGDPRLR